MKTHIVTALAGLAVGVSAMLLAQPDQMSQASFPCQEDEVLTYAPEFGPDRVGCVHFEAVNPQGFEPDTGAYVGGFN